MSLNSFRRDSHILLLPLHRKRYQVWVIFGQPFIWVIRQWKLSFQPYIGTIRNVEACEIVRDQKIPKGNLANTWVVVKRLSQQNRCFTQLLSCSAVPFNVGVPCRCLTLLSFFSVLALPAIVSLYWAFHCWHMYPALVLPCCVFQCKHILMLSCPAVLFSVGIPCRRLTCCVAFLSASTVYFCLTPLCISVLAQTAVVLPCWVFKC